MNSAKVLTALKKIVSRGEIKSNVSAKKYTTFKIGGLIKYLVQTNSLEDIKALYDYCRLNKLNFFIIGGGSNLVFSDKGFNGVCLKLSQGQFNVVNSKNPIVEFPAGFSSHLASIKMAELGYSGFECLFGLPGTLGGAIYQNSKWPKNNYQIVNNLLSVSYLNDRLNLVTANKNKLNFDYGYSSFQDKKAVIYKATFKFIRKKSADINKENQRVFSYRQKTQPLGCSSAGCIFKNPGQKSAGYLIDKAGLKGKKINDLSISADHANFFINHHQATSDDYQNLVALVKQTVKQKFNVDLKEEVLFVE